LLKLRLGEAVKGEPIAPKMERTRLMDILDMVEADYIANGRRSLDRVKFARLHLQSFFCPETRVRAITSDRVVAYQAERLGQGVKPATVNYEVAVLRRALRLGTKAGKVAMRPEISMLRVDNARKGFFEPEQHRALMMHLPDYLRRVAATAYITGWRKRELLTRQWRHVDFDAGWLRLDPGETKNGEGRMFPLTPELRAVLEAQREAVRALERKLGRVIPFLFVHPDGSAIQDFRGAWAKACKDADVPGRLLHDFRRTAVRNLERAGVARSAAMKRTGHKTEAVYRRYAIVDECMLQEAGLKLAALHRSDRNRQSSVKV
jgi:integrase